MPTKRTYMQSGPAPKRTKTLTQEVAKLKKQVSQNKHELKYYDGEIDFNDATSLRFNSFIVTSDINDTVTRANFLGRKIYVHKIEYRYTSTTAQTRMIYRCKKQARNPSSLQDSWPLLIDPEYQTMLRYTEGEQDVDKDIHIGTIDFKSQPRLVEFDNPADDPEATVTITKGDIRWYASAPNATCSFRLWYHDG